MTWFGWALVAVYAVAMLLTVAGKARKQDVQGAVTNVVTSLILITGILVFGTGTGVLQ